jgi:hypothetical protein
MWDTKLKEYYRYGKTIILHTGIQISTLYRIYSTEDKKHVKKALIL